MTWSPTNPPKRGGSYSRFLIQHPTTLPASTKGVVAVPIVHDWGPLKTFVRCESLSEFVNVFGQGGDVTTLTYTPGFVAVYNAFKGAGADDPGAAAVIVYRMGNGGAQASGTASNTTPVSAIRFRARYQGTFGNKIGWGVRTNAANPSTQHDLFVQVNGTEVESFTYAKTDIAGLATLVNKSVGGSGWITADGPGGGAVITGVALAVTSAALLTGGLDGISGLVAQDWTDVRTAYEAQAYEVFAPFDLTDTTIQTAMASWANLRNEPVGPTRSKRFMYVDGGAAAETITTALARATDHNGPNCATLGVGTYFDSALGINLSTSQLAPRLAGVIARRGVGSSIFCTHLDDLSIVVGPSDNDILSAIDGGVVVLGLDSVGVRFENSVTTYTGDTPDKPKYAYGPIKYVFTMESFERDVRLQQESGQVIGRQNNNEGTRETLVGNAQNILDDYIQEGAIQPGAKVTLTQTPPPSDDDNYVGLDWTGKFERTMDQIRNSFYLS